MPRYEVWSEGFISTGMDAKAMYLGNFEAPTFEDAVIEAMKVRGAILDDEVPNKSYPGIQTWYACRFFDNETDARKSYG